MVKIITDSTCDMDDALFKEFDISVIPLTVHLDGRVFRDGIELKLDEMYQLIDKTKTLPKTAAPTPGEFVELFKHFDDDIVFIGISTKSSATVQSARLAAKDLPSKNIQVVDSRSLSSGLALQVIEAALLARAGIQAEDIKSRLKEFRTRVRTAFIVDTLEYLYMGGRCSALQNVMGSLLQIKPMIYMQPNGALGVKKKIRGNRDKGIQALLDELRADAPNIDLRRIFISYNYCEDDVEFLTAEIRKIIPVQQIHPSVNGTVISSHCGKKTISIHYVRKP
ncbi:MAG: DegV family protein [Leptolinea sp.]|nr:DegV family protein [Leptolinea sp.]